MPTYTELLATRKSARVTAQAVRDAAYNSNLNAMSAMETTLINSQRAADDAFETGLTTNRTECVADQRADLVPLFADCIASAHAAEDCTAFAAACLAADDTARVQTSAGMGLRAVAAAAEAIIALDAEAAPGIVGALLDDRERSFNVKAANATAMQAFRNGSAVVAVDACRLIESELRRAGAINRGPLGSAMSARWSAWLSGVHM